MPLLLLNLPNEILGGIWDCVTPNDIDNFALSCQKIQELAGYDRLFEHFALKVHLTRIETGWGRYAHYKLSEVLEIFLLAPTKADYVKEMAVSHWKVCWEDPPPEHEFDWVFGTAPVLADRHCPYPNPMMKSFEKAVKDSKSIPSEEAEHWISKIRAGDQNPVIALLLPHLHDLTSINLILNDREDFFILKTLQRIVKDPRSPSLSRLREVEIQGLDAPTHRMEMAIACAALPSIISLKATRLVEGSIDCAESTFGLGPHLSSLRELTINDCTFSPNTLFKLIANAKSLCSLTLDQWHVEILGFAEPKHGLALRSSSIRNLKIVRCHPPAHTLFSLIRSAKSLRSLTYTSYFEQGTYPSFACVRAALLQCASTSLEELTLHRSYPGPDFLGLKQTECSFKSYTNLRILTIDYGLLMGDKYRMTNKVTTVLPPSIEILNLHGCHIISDFSWFEEFVGWIIRVKGRLLPCLKELNFERSYWEGRATPAQVRDLCAVAREAGIDMTVSPDPSMSWNR